MFYRNFIFFAVCLAIFAGCSEKDAKPEEIAPIDLRNVPAQQLNYRFETDIPAPDQKGGPSQSEERNEAVQADFDQNRPQESLDRTVTSPDKQRVLAVYRKANDSESEFRLDVYSPAGKIIKKVTHGEMAVHFPGTIVWSPDSNNVAFIAMVRDGQPSPPLNQDGNKTGQTGSEKPPEETKNEIDSNTSADSEASTSATPDSMEPPKDVLTFRTEQIYICDLNGEDVRPITQNEGLMYFYAVWAPDSSALVALAAPFTEWRIREFQVQKTGERFIPAGRPRLIEKNGRERLLDDYATPVHPVWSPDSAKVAVAFNKQVRIYDAIGENRTQAAIPLRNQLLLAAKAYEDKLRAEEEARAANGNTGNSDGAQDTGNSSANGISLANSNVDANAPTTTLPDANTLVSFNPIINLVWEQAGILYLETGYLKNYVGNEAENRSSYLRWHRLLLSPQSIALKPVQQP